MLLMHSAKSLFHILCVRDAEGGKTGSVWISWSTGIPALVNSTAQLPQPANRYADDYPQPPKYQFAPQTQDPASVASQVL